MKALVINTKEQALGSCTFARASAMLSDGKARVHRFYPYTIMMKPARGGLGTPVTACTPAPETVARAGEACHG